MRILYAQTGYSASGIYIVVINGSDYIMGNGYVWHTGMAYSFIVFLAPKHQILMLKKIRQV